MQAHERWTFAEDVVLEDVVLSLETLKSTPNWQVRRDLTADQPACHDPLSHAFHPALRVILLACMYTFVTR